MNIETRNYNEKEAAKLLGLSVKTLQLNSQHFQTRYIKQVIALGDIL